MLTFYLLGFRRSSYTQYLISLAIVDTGAILCEGNERKIFQTENKFCYSTCCTR